MRFFLGLEKTRSNKGIFITQRNYTLQFLSDVRFLGSKLVSTPLEVDLKLSQDDGEAVEDSTLYRRIISKLLYLIIIRLDISHSVNRLSQFLANPKVPHFKATQRVLQYVKSSPGQRLVFLIQF